MVSRMVVWVCLFFQARVVDDPHLPVEYSESPGSGGRGRTLPCWSKS